MTRLPGLRPEGKTMHEATRQGNRRLLLQLVFDDGPISRADLARATDLGRATVSEIVADLIGEGLVVEVGQGTSTGGKPPTLIELDPDGRFAVAVDLSRHPIEAALLNLRGRIVATASGKALAPTGSEVIQEVHRIVGELVGGASSPALGIGVGVPGTVDGDGRVVESEQLAWTDLPLREELEEVYGFPTHVANDAEVAAVAEFGRSSVDAAAGLLYAKVDDRVAVGIILDGQLQRTPRRGGDLTHLTVPGWTQLCQCGRTGCLGTEVSMIQLLGSDYLGLSTGARRRLASDNAPQVDDAGYALGSVLAPIVAALDIGTVVVGGELAEWPGVLPMVGAGIEERLGWCPQVDVTRLGASAVILGAAGMVLSEELGVVWG